MFGFISLQRSSDAFDVHDVIVLLISLLSSEENGDSVSQECELLFTDEIFQIPSVNGEKLCKTY